MKRNRKGFTLVEVIVVLVILAILAAIMVPAMTGWIDKSKTKICNINVLSLNRHANWGVIADEHVADNEQSVIVWLESLGYKVTCTATGEPLTFVIDGKADPAAITISCPNHPLDSSAQSADSFPALYFATLILSDKGQAIMGSWTGQINFSGAFNADGSLNESMRTYKLLEELGLLDSFDPKTQNFAIQTIRGADGKARAEAMYYIPDNTTYLDYDEFTALGYTVKRPEEPNRRTDFKAYLGYKYTFDADGNLAGTIPCYIEQDKVNAVGLRDIRESDVYEQNTAS